MLRTSLCQNTERTDGSGVRSAVGDVIVDGLEKFRQFMDVVYDNAEATIYRRGGERAWPPGVRPASLPKIAFLTLPAPAMLPSYYSNHGEIRRLVPESVSEP
jgi:hypothetical protein